MGRIARDDGKGDLVVALSVPAQTFLGLPQAEQEDLRVLAIPIFTLLQKGDYAGANAILDSLGMDDTYAVAIWYLFDSRQRAAMKAARRDAQE